MPLHGAALIVWIISRIFGFGSMKGGLAVGMLLSAIVGAATLDAFMQRAKDYCPKVLIEVGHWPRNDAPWFAGLRWALRALGWILSNQDRRWFRSCSTILKSVFKAVDWISSHQDNAWFRVPSALFKSVFQFLGWVFSALSSLVSNRARWQ